ncbi:hypothetical protein REPUB_Repub17cG0132900 [Reevesia pubescens]
MASPHVQAESSTGSSEGSAYAKHKLTLKEQLQLQYLSQELEIDIHENEKPDIEFDKLGGPENKRAPRLNEKRGILNENDDSDEHLERNMQVLETLQMQVEVQKLLHEQLKVQRELQLQLEQQGQFLRKLMDEQQKSGSDNNLTPPQCFPSANKTAFQTEKPFMCSSEAASSQKAGDMSITDCSSTHSPKHKASQTTEPEQCQKRHRGESKLKTRHPVLYRN